MGQHSIAFIGGGNMASALIGGLVRSGLPAALVIVVEPSEVQRIKLLQQHGVQAQASADDRLGAAGTVVWAVKPQLFAEAASPCAAFVGQALQVSVMAGVRSDAIAATTGAQAVVRSMPNTPALIGRGIAGLFARDAVSAEQRSEVTALFAPTGDTLWVAHEDQLDAITALSGSGPAYMFYVLEALTESGVLMGLSPEDSRRLAQSTMAGAAALALASPLTLAELRATVTSKGGTTEAAIRSLDEDDVKSEIVKAVLAAQRRAEQLGRHSGPTARAVAGA